MPITYAVMTIGTLAITGVGIPGLDLGFAGFYSKDTIIESAFAAGHEYGGVAWFAFFVGIFAAGLTAFYSWRLAFMTFHGTAKWALTRHMMTMLLTVMMIMQPTQTMVTTTMAMITSRMRARSPC